MDFYPWLKALHILLAIVAVGFNISYVVLILVMMVVMPFS